MTIKPPRKTWIDRLIALFGWEREIEISEDANELARRLWPYGIFKGKGKCKYQRKRKERKTQK